MLEEVCGDPEEVWGAVEPKVVLPGWLVLPQVPPRQPAGDLRLAQAVHRRAKVHHPRGVGVFVVGVHGAGDEGLDQEFHILEVDPSPGGDQAKIHGEDTGEGPGAV